jgi:hypothetical protein
VSRRYECGRAPQTGIGILSGRDATQEEVLTAAEVRAGQHALVLGDPYASAYAVTGTPAEIDAFLCRARVRVLPLFPPGEADGGWLAGFRVAGFEDEAVAYTAPVAVTCQAGHRYDSGGEPALLAALVTWAANHRVCRKDAG